MTCFSLTPGFNELDVFEIRLAELDKVVDIHVVAEAPWTYKGTKKPLYFTEKLASGDWDKWRDKIRIVVVDDPPPVDYPVFQPFGDPDRWRRENWQRAALARGLDGLEPDDIVIVSDLDEIPRHETITEYQIRELRHVVRPHLPMHVGMMNLRWYFALGVILRVFRGSEFLENGHDPESIRQANNVEDWAVPNWPLYIDDEAPRTFDLARYGWHLAYMGGVDMIRYKVREAAHPELEKPELLTDHHLERVLDGGIDIFARHDRPSYWIPNNLLPRYVQQRKRRFAHMLCDEPFTPTGGLTGPLAPGYYWQPTTAKPWSPAA